MLLRASYTLLLFAFLKQGVLSQPCSTPPINLAVYEGTLDTLMTCNRLLNVTWQVYTSTDPLTTVTITSSGDTVNPSLTGLYGASQAGLTIKNATTTPGTNPIATAGLYIVKASSTVKRGAKLLVVREGPMCSCSAINSTSLQINCSVKYADSSYQPINAVMNWTSNGNFYTSNTPQRTLVEGNWYDSTSKIIVDDNVPADYQCTQTFGQPTNIQFAYVATNAPVFTASCTIPACITTEPTTTTWSTATPEPTTECNCSSCPTCPPVNQNCAKEDKCWPGDKNLTEIYDECVVKAELYVKCDRCCQDALLCGVVVTLRNDSRWLIHDPLCGDGKCEMVVADASCMSSDWKLLADKKVIVSGVGDYVEAGNIFNVTVSDCSESCYRLMNLP